VGEIHKIPRNIMEELAKESFEKRTDVGSKAESPYLKGFSNGFDKCQELMVHLLDETLENKEVCGG